MIFHGQTCNFSKTRAQLRLDLAQAGIRRADEDHLRVPSIEAAAFKKSPPKTNMKKTKKTARKILSASPSSEPNLEDIEMVAYLIWEQEGRPHGNHETHWLQTEAQLRQG